MTNGSLNYRPGKYFGTFNNIKKDFELKYKSIPIFQRYFDSSSNTIVNPNTDTVKIPYHFYNTGEEIRYSYPVGSEPIGIGTTTILGIGSTDKLPSSLYVVKVNEQNISLAATAEDALKTIPKILDITSVGIGTKHIFTSKNQNNKVIIGIDNVIQSPIVSTSITSILTKYVSGFDTIINISGISSFVGGDLIKIDNEIMRVSSVGIGSTVSQISIVRSLLGTGLSTHSSSSLVTKILGNYNIVDNTIHFADAPYGKVPFTNPSSRWDEIDYVGISTGSSFSGRVFLRSGTPNTSEEIYSKNYIFDNISDDFDGKNKSFTIKSNGSDITGISTNNSIILINSIFQGPNGLTQVNDYDLTEVSGITSITFTGDEIISEYDVNTSSIPRGGIIVSVASTGGFGYQPLISAGGTAIVSSAGTIQSISIGNSGSGYRSGIQTVVNVGVKTESTRIVNIEFIGTATISNGNIVGVSITNPGVGYTASNPPIVVFDAPLSYSNIPLIYSSQSPSGVGTGAKVDIIVGQGSSVISFDIKNLGYGYERNQILTVSIGGTTGIPTNTSIGFSEFQLQIDSTHSDSFSGWSIGNLQVIDSIDSLFNGTRKSFPILINGNQTTIRAKKGSNIDVQATLLVFINDILQVPGSGYIFKGGSRITFTEAPKEGDKSKIIFYAGTSDVDTKLIDILETIKVGDKVRLNSDDINLTQDQRLVTDIVSSDVINTNLYPGPGISQDENLLRPLIWCRQTDDITINGSPVTKDRIIYEPYIQPSTNIIQNVGSSSTIMFVESIKSFFDSELEYLHNGTNEKPQNKIMIISQDTIVSASATAIVSPAGSIQSITIENSGIGYTIAPTVSIANPTGIGSTGRSTATSSLNGSSISLITVVNSGFGYTSSNPPPVLIETPNAKSEIIDEVSYEGDFGIIVGVQTTSVGSATTGLVFDFFIPTNSFLRGSYGLVKVGVASTGISGIQTGYYFSINNSNIGYGLTSLDSLGNVVGVGTSFIDNIYQVAAVSIGQTAVPGIGITNVTKVITSLSSYNGLVGLGYSNFYGEYSWGRINISSRKNPQEFTSYANIGGISTSPIVQRYNRLKYIGYSTS